MDLNATMEILPAEISIYFGGGFDAKTGTAVSAVYVTNQLYTHRRITGHHSAGRAEANGALDALRMLEKILEHNHAITTVHIRGDHHDVVMALATETETLKAVPGRSACPKTWAAIRVAREAVRRLLREADRMVSIMFEWVPRAQNAMADHLCACAQRQVPPSFGAVGPIPEPTLQHGKPTADDLTLIAQRLAAGDMRTSWKSIPPALRVSWHAVLTRVAEWDNVWALYLAPAVLLQRYGSESPYHRLQRMATMPHLIEQYFWHAAHGDVHNRQDPEQPVPANEAPRDVRDRLVERLAAHSPSRALRLMFGTPPADPRHQVVQESVGQRFVRDDGILSDEPTSTRPEWIGRGIIMKVTGTQLARAASPGPDGWTREILIASFCKPTLGLFEILINNIAQNNVPTYVAELLRSARLAAWKKHADTSDHRVIGMTSTIMKLTWKILTAQHLSAHNVAGNIATYTKGGTIGVVRWAESRYAAGEKVYMADVVDAYWAVQRRQLAAHLSAINSPLAHIFHLAYSAPAACTLGGTTHYSRAGIIPGCGGGSILFAIETQRHIKPASFTDPRISAIYADDVTVVGREAYEAAVCAYHPKELAKLRILAPQGTAADEERPYVKKAARLLGAYIGEITEATALLREDVNERLEKLSRVIRSSLNCQTKWALLRTIELGLRWKFAATNPSITSSIAASVDDALAAAVFALADGTPNHKSRTLIYLPIASGGLGFAAYAMHGATLFNAAAARATWPPRQLGNEEDGVIEQAITSKQILGDLRDALIADAQTSIGHFEISARSSDTTPWFNIPAITRHHAITDEEFTTMMGEFLRCDIDLPTCTDYNPEHGSKLDHSHTCYRCAGPYRYQRHNMLQRAFQMVCLSYGIQTTDNFYGHFGTRGNDKKPDIIVFRSSESLPLVIDFTIPHQAEYHKYDVAQLMTVRKSTKYANWHTDKVQMAPFVLTTMTVPHATTMKVIQELDKLAVRRGFAREAIARLKIALVRFETFRRKSLGARNASGALDVAPANTSDGEENPNDEDAE